VKILKHSTRLFLHVIEGSKRMSLLFSLAMTLAAFLLGVSEKMSWWNPGLSGFSLGLIWRIHVRASWAHWCGLEQPSSLSRLQCWHSHMGMGRCGTSMLGACILSDMVTRSTTFVTACRRRRHFAGMVVIGQGVASGWYEAGSCS